MVHWIVLAAIVVLSGLANRIRGGLWSSTFNIGTQGARIAFTVVMGGFTALAFGSWWALVSIVAWVICEFLPNGDYLGMTSFLQFLEATAVGIGNVSLVAVSIFFLVSHLGWIPLLIAGALKGVVYYVANYKLTWWPKNIPGFSAGAEMAEFIFGLVLGTGLVVGGIVASL